MKMSKTRVLLLLSALYTALWIIAPFFSVKLATFMGMKFPLGNCIITLALLIVDVVNNNWSKSEARAIVMNGFISRVFIYGAVVPAALAWPAVAQPKELGILLPLIMKAVFAAELSIFVGQYFLDIPMFAYLKERFGKTGFGVRYNLTNLASAIVSAVIFTLIVFWGRPDMLHVIVANIVMRFGFSLALTPLASVANKLVSKAG